MPMTISRKPYHCPDTGVYDPARHPNRFIEKIQDGSIVGYYAGDRDAQITLELRNRLKK